MKCESCSKPLSGRGKGNLCQKCRARKLMIDRWQPKMEADVVLKHLDTDVAEWLKGEVSKTKCSISVMVASIIEDAYHEELHDKGMFR